MGTATMKDTVDLHVRWLRSRGLADSTIYQRRRAVTRLERSGVDPIHADTAELLDWALDLTTGPEARATEISHVRQWFAWLAMSGRRDDNPAVDLDRPKLGQPLPRPMRDEDLELARDLADVEVATWLTLAGYAGLRCAEIAQLRRDDLQDQALYVRGKGARDRIVPASTFVWRQLEHWGIAGRHWIFPRRDGNPGPRPPWVVSHVGNEHLRSCGVDATMHRARHRYATRLYAETHDIVLVQRMLGHSSLRTTQRYVGWSDSDASDAVELIVPA